MGLSTDEVDNSARPARAMRRSFFRLLRHPIDLTAGNQVPQDLSMGLSTIEVDKAVIPSRNTARESFTSSARRSCRLVALADCRTSRALCCVTESIWAMAWWI